MFKLRNWRQWLVFIGVVIIAGVLIWWGYGWYRNQPASHRFIGQALSVNGNEIKVFGFHVLEPDSTKSDTTHRQPVTVQFDSNTKFVKVVYHIPISTEQAGDPSFLKGVSTAGSIDDLKSKQLFITITTANDSLNEQTLKAVEIDYNVQIYAELLTAPSPKK